MTEEATSSRCETKAATGGFRTRQPRGFIAEISSQPKGQSGNSRLRSGRIAPPDQKWSDQQRAKKQEDQNERFRRNHNVAYEANSAYEYTDGSGYAASLATHCPQSRQNKKHDEPEYTQACARERRIGENGNSKSRWDVSPLDRPPQPIHVGDAMDNADE